MVGSGRAVNSKAGTVEFFNLTGSAGPNAASFGADLSSEPATACAANRHDRFALPFAKLTLGCWQISAKASTHSMRNKPQARGGPRGEPRHDGRGGKSELTHVRIWGIHAVEAALRNPARTLKRLRVTENARQRLDAAILARGIQPEIVNARDFDRDPGADVVHQGAVLDADVLPDLDPRDFAPGAKRNDLVIVLDQVTDPHNVGAILRSAAAFGARGMVMTARNSPPLDGTLAKAASGGLELVPVAVVPNLARALEQLAEIGYFRIGLDGTGDGLLEAQKFDGPTVLVLGAEDTGMRRLTRENCDVVCKITTAGGLASLNVSNAAAVAMHAVMVGGKR
jgi:23S rRNA (guanosine2251-2'-O)-methyltransferase